ncbi:MAG: spore protease YyaC [Lachnospiraceae bacterium]|nr:spore protease YyaC [Lachnospiraceae bacterium]
MKLSVKTPGKALIESKSTGNSPANSEGPVFYYNSADRHAAKAFGDKLLELIAKRRPDRSHAAGRLIFLCIGSDRATGDCLGPIIGYKLSRRKLSGCSVYGTLESPVHAGNLAQTIESIELCYENPFIIAIDASLGRSSHIGYFTLGSGPLKPGAGVDKELPSVGDLFITGIVNLSGCLDHMLLQTTRLHTVMRLADQICDGITGCIGQLLEEWPEENAFLDPESVNTAPVSSFLFSQRLSTGSPAGTAAQRRIW